MRSTKVLRDGAHATRGLQQSGRRVELADKSSNRKEERVDSVAVGNEWQTEGRTGERV